VVPDVRARNLFEHALVGGSDVDFREFRREQPREIDVVGLNNSEAAWLLDESLSQHVAEDLGISVCGQSDDLALVPAALESEHRRAGLVDSAERVWNGHAMNALDFPAPADARASGEAGPVAVERHDERFVEAALVVRVRRVAQMMVHALELVLDAEL